MNNVQSIMDNLQRQLPLLARILCLLDFVLIGDLRTFYMIS